MTAADTNTPYPKGPLWRLECLNAEYKGVADLIRWLNVTYEDEDVSQPARQVKQSALYFIAQGLERLNDEADKLHVQLIDAQRAKPAA